jgi:hypothetical protein
VLLTFTVDQIGSFVGKEEYCEYAILAVDPNWVQINSSLDTASIIWTNVNTIAYQTISNYSTLCSLCFDGFVNHQVLAFQLTPGPTCRALLPGHPELTVTN